MELHRDRARRTVADRHHRTPTGEGKLYLCGIKDVYSGRIVGYSISDRMKSHLAVDALNSAVARQGLDGGDTAGCIVHPDRGSRFRSRRFRAALCKHELVGSMGQVASAGDNAAMRSFLALLQKNGPDRRRWTTREQLRIAVITWIERAYHRRRRQQRLGRLTPTESEPSSSLRSNSPPENRCHLSMQQSGAVCVRPECVNCPGASPGSPPG